MLGYTGLLSWLFAVPWAIAERRSLRLRERRVAEREALAEWRVEAAHAALLRAVRLTMRVRH
jgi:hypothetical protein